MNDLTSQTWFGWAVGLAIVLPIVLIALTALFARDLGRAIDIRTRSQVAAWTALAEGRRPGPEVSSVNLLRTSTS